MTTRVLVADDDPALREMMAMALTKEGFAVVSAASAAEVRQRLEETAVDLVVCDIYLGDATALELMGTLRAACPAAPVILVTAQGTVETAAAAAAAGVVDYLGKPFAIRALVERVRAALERGGAASAPVALGPDSMIVGSHPSIVEVYTAVARVAPLPVPVLLRGETGTGKELVARALHRFGASSAGPFVAVNCGAIPEQLLESELFGHRRGAFTGAERDHVGAIASARDGTLLLDEVGELPVAMQVKLLRFLQEGEVRPLGAERSTVVPVRVVAATHRDLRREAATGGFREDLYYRLAAYEIELPPLRRRRADIPQLVEHFRRRLEERLGAPIQPPSPPVLALLQAEPWPGNVRQLEHLVQRAVVDLGTLADAAGLRRILARQAPPEAAPAPPAAGDDITLEELERRHVEAVLARCGGNRTHAARILGIERKSLYRKAKRFGLELDGGAGGAPSEEEEEA